MSASLLKSLRAGPPPPTVALLPDALFFARAAPLPSGSLPAEVPAQVELTLEAVAPFPLAQLYYGYYWKPGAERALAFASYRRRFTVEQVAAWSGAERVLPAFAAVLGWNAPPASTVVLSSSEGLTAVHWDHGPVPAAVLHRPLPPEATDEERARIRDELLKAAGESATIVELAGAPVAVSGGDGELVFRCGEFESRFPAQIAAALDVRDKTELAAIARARRRDVLLWKTALGCAVACVLLLLGELGLVAGGFWQKARLIKLNAQNPIVGRVIQDQELANRIDELSTKRLLPLEMISIVAAKKPSGVQFLRTITSGINVLQVEAQTNNAGEIAGFVTAVQGLPACDRVEIFDQRTRDNLASFRLVVSFKPAALKPMSAPTT